MNPPWKDNRYSLIQWTCSYHKRRYRIRKTASMQWYNPRLWSYRKTWRNVTHPSDVSASRCRGSLVLATADRNRRLPLCWRAPSCRQKYRATWRNVTRPIPPTCLPHGVAAACFVLATADKKAETHNHLSIIFNPSVGSLCHFCATATRFSYRFPIFETSATALCGTTGMKLWTVYAFYFMIQSSGMLVCCKNLRQWNVLNHWNQTCRGYLLCFLFGSVALRWFHCRGRTVRTNSTGKCWKCCHCHPESTSSWPQHMDQAHLTSEFGDGFVNGESAPPNFWPDLASLIGKLWEMMILWHDATPFWARLWSLMTDSAGWTRMNYVEWSSHAGAQVSSALRWSLGLKLGFKLILKNIPSTWYDIMKCLKLHEIAYPCKRSVTQFVAEVWNWLWPKVEHIFIKSEDSPETAELIRQLPTEDQAKVLVPHRATLARRGRGKHGETIGSRKVDSKANPLWQVTVWESAASLRQMLRCSAWDFLWHFCFTAGKVGGDTTNTYRCDINFHSKQCVQLIIIVVHQDQLVWQLRFLTVKQCPVGVSSSDSRPQDDYTTLQAGMAGFPACFAVHSMPCTAVPGPANCCHGESQASLRRDAHWLVPAPSM